MQISALYNIIFIIVFIGYFSLTPSPAAAMPHPSIHCTVGLLCCVVPVTRWALQIPHSSSSHSHVHTQVALEPVRGIHTRQQQQQQQQTKTGKYCCRLHAKDIYGLGSLVIAAKQAGNIQWENNNIHLRLYSKICVVIGFQWNCKKVFVLILIHKS